MEYEDEITERYKSSSQRQRNAGDAKDTGRSAQDEGQEPGANATIKS